MRILITGGLGFVGGRVAEGLLEAGHEVFLGTRKPTFVADYLPGAIVTQMRWQDSIALEKVCTEIDVVIHAAGMNSKDCADDPVAAIDFNGLSTARLALAASRSKVERFLYLSTAHVYSDPLVGEITEESCPRNLHPYATSHLAGEHVVLQRAKFDDMSRIVLRLSNIFGAPAHKEADCWMLLVNDLCRQTVQTGRMVLKTRGLQYRDFVSMKNVCRVISSLAASERKDKSSVVYNLGSGTSQTVLSMARIIQERSKQVLGFEPDLLRPEIDLSEANEELFSYKTERLGALGVEMLENPIEEIDELLRYCAAQFSRLY